jgi:pimeloyl-ACP methyl ester carboxylesterase
MKQMPVIVYLHGLGASPQSKKGVLVRERFAPKGFEVRSPDLNIPSLSELSVTEALRCVGHELRQVRERLVFLVGSSFGGFLALRSFALLAPETRRNVCGIALLAPVIDPWDPTSRLFTPDVELQWRRDGAYPMVRADDGSSVSIHYRFVEELRSLAQAELSLDVPILIIHGTRDAVVPHAQSVRFSREHPAVQLVLLDEEHQLLERPEDFLEALEVFFTAQHE